MREIEKIEKNMKKYFA